MASGEGEANLRRGGLDALKRIGAVCEWLRESVEIGDEVGIRANQQRDKRQERSQACDNPADVLHAKRCFRPRRHGNSQDKN